ncbi:hypothetical protein [Nocardioides sp.]|uniref:hypothetical protein n=1 Tax=Nocardioides sp. TaxID=35761 RepID=UPI003D0E5370
MTERIEVQLDQERHTLVAAEAEHSGRSIDDVIGECIDVAFDEFRRARLRAQTRVEHFPNGASRQVEHRDEEFLSPEDDA